MTSLFEFGSEPFIALREKIWLETFSQALQARLAGLIFTFAFDQTVANDFPDKVRNLVEENGGKVIFVELKCSSEELEKRIAHPSRANFGKLNSVEFFRELFANGVFDHPKIAADFIVETTFISAVETARLIAQRLEIE